MMFAFRRKTKLSNADMRPFSSKSVGVAEGATARTGKYCRDSY